MSERECRRDPAAEAASASPEIFEYHTFQLAEVAVPRTLFAETLRLIDQLRPAALPP